MHTDKKNGSQKSIVQRLNAQRASLVLGVVLLLVVIPVARPLGTTLYLNLGYLELARRTPAVERARDFFRRAAVMEPQASGVAQAFGMLALAEEDWPTAHSLLQRTIAKEPDDAFAHWQLGRALDGMDELKAAADEYRLAGASVYFLNAALRQRHQKDWQGAERNFLRALDIVPQDAKVARSVGEFYREWGKPDRAKFYLERALEFERRGYERALLRGELADLQSDTMGAETAFREAMRQMPTHPDAPRLLAELYLARGDRMRAIRALEMGSADAAPAFGLNLRLAHLLIENKNWLAAERALALARLEQANNDEVYLITAQLELARNKPDAALAALERALTLAPHNAESHFWSGRALAHAGQCTAAHRAYATAMALASDDARFAPAQQTWGACK